MHGIAYGTNARMHPFLLHKNTKETDMKRIIITTAASAASLAVGLFAGPVYAQAFRAPILPDSRPLDAEYVVNKNNQDKALRDYVRGASQGYLFEIETSRIALARTKDQNIAAYAQRMIDAHTRASDRLNDVIGGQSLRAAQGNRLEQDTQYVVANLQSVNDFAFDRTYMRMQLHAHRQALRVHQNYAAAGDNRPLAAFAMDSTAAVLEHIDRAQHIELAVASK